MTVENNEKTTGGVTGKGFMPGQSGNPGGRPKVVKEFIERCREYMNVEGIDSLIEIARDPKDKDKMRAIELLAGYAWGKPKQGVKFGDEDGGGITIVVKPADSNRDRD